MLLRFSLFWRCRCMPVFLQLWDIWQSFVSMQYVILMVAEIMNKLLKIGLVGVLSLSAFKLFGMKAISDKLKISLVNSKISKADTSGIVFSTDISLENPTRFSMSITKPFITVTTNGAYVSGNSPEKSTYTIEPLAATFIKNIQIPISWQVWVGYATGVLTKIPKIIDAVRKKDMSSIASALSIPIEMKYSLYANNMYYESAPEKIL